MLRNLLLLLVFLFYNATVTWDHDPWFKKLCFSRRHPRKCVGKGTQGLG